MDESEEPGTSLNSEEDAVFETVVGRKKKGRRKPKFKPFDKFQIVPQKDTSIETIDNDENVFDGISVNFVENDRVSTDGHMTVKASVLVSPITGKISSLTPKNIETEQQQKTYPEKEIESAKEEEPAILYQKRNTKPLTKHDTTYRLENFKKNLLFIFNHRYVVGYEERLGTEKDEAKLKETFGKFGFIIEVMPDYTKEEIMKKMDEFNDMDFTEYGCVAVVVLTHGTTEGFIYAQDQKYNELEILKYFKVDTRPTLVTKPKVLIIQACRGHEDISGVQVHGMSAKIRKDSGLTPVEPYTLPVESDMLVLHSSYIGKGALRDIDDGSWFIQTLCDKINELAAEKDFESIITETKRKVAIEMEHAVFNRLTSQIDINKQMPVTTSTLIRKLYLRSYNDNSLLSQPVEELTQALSQNIMTSDHTQIDGDIPTTSEQTTLCNCFLKHFEYMKGCLNQYVIDHPNDQIAKNFQALTNSFAENPEFDKAKLQSLLLVSSHLAKVENSNYLKYVYFYE